MTLSDRSPGHETCHHRTYLLDCAQYEMLLARAAGKCELCGTPTTQCAKGKLDIDHEHRIGLHAVRGLVCQTCNAHMRRVDSGERAMSWDVAAYLLLSGHVLPPGTSRRPPQPVGRRGEAIADQPRTVRIPQGIWDDFGSSCGHLGSNRTEQVIQFMLWITGQAGAAKPQRPSVQQLVAPG